MLVPPLDEKQVRGLKIGDVVHVTGTIYTGRDEMHIRALEYLDEGKGLPVEMEGSILFHCGPLVRKGDGTWELVAAGPTTSARMNALEPEFIRAFRPAAIVGKGGMSAATVKAMEECGCVYLVITGGAAVLAARGVKRVVDVHWLDLGIPEALWVLEVEHFGPLTVAIDAHGNSLYERIEAEVKERLPEIRKKLGID